MIHAMCEDYRAGVTVDLEHDAADRGRVLGMPALVLYGASGVMARAYDVEAVWQERFSDMSVGSVPGGHFFIDQSPGETAEALVSFLT